MADRLQLARVEREMKAMADSDESVLNLNYCRLREIPEQLLCSEYCKKKLQKLYLKRNCISKLNADLSNLHSLTDLYLHSNNLNELPHDVSLLSSLTSLDVSFNNITTLTPSLCQLKQLITLNLGSNKLASLPEVHARKTRESVEYEAILTHQTSIFHLTELWRVPALQCLNVSSNELKSISVEIVRCQSLQTLYLDSNKLTVLPLQVTKLFNLEYLSVCGNQLTVLPNDFSATPKLRQLCADSNPGIAQVPVSLAPLSWWGTLGMSGCSVYMEEQNIGVTKVIHECPVIVPLLELAARSLHRILRDALLNSMVLWLPREICNRLHLPSGLEEWLVPSGKCFVCKKPYFKNYCSLQVSAAYYIALTRGVCKPANLALSVDYCSQTCMSSST